MESKALVKSTNSNVACKFFARTPSRILWMVSICEVVDLFLRKPFWFFLRMLSILGSIYIYIQTKARKQESKQGRRTNLCCVVFEESWVSIICV